jgi:hypothetical protein
MLPGFIREEIEQLGVDIADDEAVELAAAIVVGQLVGDILDSIPGMPERLRMAFVADKAGASVELRNDGWPFDAVVRLAPSDIESAVRGAVVRAIWAMQQEAAKAGQ